MKEYSLLNMEYAESVNFPETAVGTSTVTEFMIKNPYKSKIVIEAIPEDPDVKAITGKMKRGDLDKMSFAFQATIQEWDDSEDVPLRTIKEAQLFDVSIVNTPAYDATDIGLRSLEKYRDQVRRETNFKAARKRLQMKGRLDLKEREKGAQQPAAADSMPAWCGFFL